MNYKVAVLAITMGLSALGAEAALVGRLQDGSGNFNAYYDNVLNITWLADTNLAATQTFGVSGIMAGSNLGRMDFATAGTWLAAMNSVGSTGYLGYNDWRMPTTGPVNGVALDATIMFDGTTDAGYSMSAPGTMYAGSTGSEMAHLYYNTFGNLARVAPDGTDPQFGYKVKNWGSFANVELHRYMSGTTFGPDKYWMFSMGNGNQRLANKIPANFFETGFVWVVRSGDVSAAVVPVPAAIWLFASGLFALVGMTKRR